MHQCRPASGCRLRADVIADGSRASVGPMNIASWVSSRRRGRKHGSVNVAHENPDHRVILPISGHDHLMATFCLRLFYYAALSRRRTTSYIGLWYRGSLFMTPSLLSRDLKLCLRCIEVDIDFWYYLVRVFRRSYIFWNFLLEHGMYNKYRSSLSFKL